MGDHPCMADTACGCESDSGDPDFGCDCAMQGHCICGDDCNCKESICKDAEH